MTWWLPRYRWKAFYKGTHHERPSNHIGRGWGIFPSRAILIADFSTSQKVFVSMTIVSELTAARELSYDAWKEQRDRTAQEWATRRLEAEKAAEATRQIQSEQRRKRAQQAALQRAQKAHEEDLRKKAEEKAQQELVEDLVRKALEEEHKKAAKTKELSGPEKKGQHQKEGREEGRSRGAVGPNHAPQSWLCLNWISEKDEFVRDGGPA